MAPKKADSSLSTLAVDRELADRVREVADEYGATNLDMTNRLLEYALESGKVEVEVKKVTVVPSNVPKGEREPPRRGRPRKRGR